MASKIKAINAYRPRIELGATVQKQELVRYLSGRTGLNEGELDLVLRELRDAVIFFNRAGRGVKIEGLGTYLPNIRLDGTFNVQHRLDRDVQDGLNTPGTFTGTILNRENIGKTADELVAIWNQQHPDDPVT
ncbi:MAG: hypothetical protein D6784_18400 [Chloroflexi bacterium]|nr:MAG: hypothetical protein D6784_18400 [Chloroflexota bacterium]